MKQILFITGTDTGAGKTVLATLWVRFLRGQGVSAAGLKPICSGGRGDADAMVAAMDGALTRDEINPWHFRAPIAPALAARKEGAPVDLKKVVAHVCAVQKRFDVVVVEGAGGLLSPLGKNFDSRDLLLALAARPIIVAPNRLGTINHVLLTLEALPEKCRRTAKVVLMAPQRPDSATNSNAALLGESFDVRRIFLLPRLKISAPASLRNDVVRRTLHSLMR